MISYWDELSDDSENEYYICNFKYYPLNISKNSEYYSEHYISVVLDNSEYNYYNNYYFKKKLLIIRVKNSTIDFKASIESFTRSKLVKSVIELINTENPIYNQLKTQLELENV